MAKKPPTNDTPKDVTQCGPCVWLFQPPKELVTETTYLQIRDILDTYSSVLHQKFRQ